VQTYASNRKSKADLAQAVPQSLRPPEDAEDPDADAEDQEEQDQSGQAEETEQLQSFDPMIGNSASAFSF